LTTLAKNVGAQMASPFSMICILVPSGQVVLAPAKSSTVCASVSELDGDAESMRSSGELTVRPRNR
jgi:hypothetical protein